MARNRNVKRRPEDLDNQLQQLDQLIAAQAWPQAKPLATALFDANPTGLGVLERAVMVLRELGEWRALADLMLEARNTYGLWAQGSELLLGRALMEQGKVRQALPLLEEAVAQESSAGWAHHFLGQALRQQGRYEEALEQQREASRHLQDFAWAPFEAAELLVLLGRKVEAAAEALEAQRRISRQEADQGGAIDQLLEELRPALLSIEAGQLLDQGDRDEALQVIREGLIADPDSPALQRLVMRCAKGAANGDFKADEEPDPWATELASIALLLDAFEAQLEARGL